MNAFRQVSRTSWLGHAAWPVLVSAALLLQSSPARAQSSPSAALDEDDVEAEAGNVPTSVEQGQTPLDEAFGPRDRAAWIRETRRKAFEDTKYNVQLRTFYLDRDKYDDTESTAWALGGSAGLKTGYFRERFALGATGYTSQRLYGPDDKDGTLLLKPGQEGYTVLGEVYGEFLFNQDTRLTFGRFGIDTPYVNRNDARMTPNTFQAIALQGLYGGDDGKPAWHVGAGYFDQIKERNSDEFVSMAKDAGAPDGVKRGVYTLGANYKSGNLTAGAIGYHSNDILNIFYTEAKYAIPLTDALKLQLGLQYTDQKSTGDNLLRGADFDSDQWGGKAELGYKGALFTTAYTRAGGGTNMQNPWSGYPGYTSVQVEDFNRDGESAWMLRATYAFQSVKGASIYALYVDGSDPDSPTEYAKDEYNFNIQWTVPEGVLKGLMLRLRYAHVEQKDPARSDLDDLRILIFYDPPSL